MFESSESKPLAYTFDVKVILRTPCLQKGRSKSDSIMSHPRSRTAFLKSVAHGVSPCLSLSEQNSPLLRLPPELRDKILRYLLTSSVALHPSPHRFGLDANTPAKSSDYRDACPYRISNLHDLCLEILRVNKRLYIEGTAVLTRQNTVLIKVVEDKYIDVLGYRIDAKTPVTPRHRASRDCRRFNRFELMIVDEIRVKMHNLSQMYQVEPLVEGARQLAVHFMLSNNEQLRAVIQTRCSKLNCRKVNYINYRGFFPIPTVNIIWQQRWEETARQVTAYADWEPRWQCYPDLVQLRAFSIYSMVQAVNTLDDKCYEEGQQWHKSVMQEWVRRHGMIEVDVLDRFSSRLRLDRQFAISDSLWSYLRNAY